MEIGLRGDNAGEDVVGIGEDGSRRLVARGFDAEEVDGGHREHLNQGRNEVTDRVSRSRDTSGPAGENVGHTPGPKPPPRRGAAKQEHSRVVRVWPRTPRTSRLWPR